MKTSISIYKVTISEAGIIWVKSLINGKLIKMQLDTGLSRTIISCSDSIRNFDHKILCGTNVVIRTYFGKELKSLSYDLVNVRLNDKCYKLKLLVVNVRAPPLMGRDWLNGFCDRHSFLNLFNLC